MYAYKGLCKGMRSGYDPNFVYQKRVNKHPEPDRESKDACGVGLHLCKRIIDIPNFIPNLNEIWLTEYNPEDVIAEDETKIRLSKINLVKGIKWAKLKPIYDRYLAELKTINDRYWTERNTIEDRYGAELKQVFMVAL